MGRIHYLQDRAKIMRRIPTLDHGIVQNTTRGIVDETYNRSYDEQVNNDYPDVRSEESDWIPARLRLPAGDEEVFEGGAKVDLAIRYELVLYGWDESGREVQPTQHDEFIIKYKRDGSLTDTTTRFRITGTIQEIRKRNKLYTFVMPVVMHTEF